MLEAAYRLFSGRGYTVSMAAIAAEAGVAPQTVTFTFHTKLALLEKTLEFAVLGDDQPIPPYQREWFQQLHLEADPRRVLDAMVENTLPILERAAPLAIIFETLSDDPEATAYWARSEQMRHEGFRQHMELLARNGGLKEGLTVDEATDIFFAVLSPQLFRATVSGRSWGAERWRAAIQRILVNTLLPGGGQG